MSDIEKKSASNEAVGHHEDGDGTLAALPPDPDAHLSPQDRAARVSYLLPSLYGSNNGRYTILTSSVTRTASFCGV